MSVQSITLDEIRGRMQSGQPLCIVDVRTPAEFARVHAAGARLIPLDELDPAAVAAARSGPKDPVYLICHSGSRAAKACEQLQEAGVRPAICIEGGTAAWERLGLPVERGQTRVISLDRQVRLTAGSLVLLGLVLAWLVHPYFVGISAFIGAGLVFSGITDFCGMAMLLAKMPWNQRGAACVGLRNG
ncbi:MAG TPA: rhodanese-like domain-containing protein [Tepidisphaeraceae bacterium]|jgi:rhodanese-related sulfurtransferase